MRLILNPAALPGILRGEITPPGDKSISHRALMIGSLTQGESRFSNCLRSEDVLATEKMMRLLGVAIENSGSDVTVTGVGLASFTEPNQIIDVGNSGTTLRLGLGLVVPSKIFTVLSGDSSILKRPVDRVIGPLSALGASLLSRFGSTMPPVVVSPQAHLVSSSFQGTVPSAQVKSAFLLAAAQIPGISQYSEMVQTRNHTELMLQAAGADLEQEDKTIRIAGAKPLEPLQLRIPGDPSSAAFWIVAGLIHPDAELYIHDVGFNQRRTGFVRVLKGMGGDIQVLNPRQWGGEDVADIVVRSSRLQGCQVPAEQIPDLIDEVPILAVAAAHAAGTTRFTGVSELRVKESDRIAAISTQFSSLGVSIRQSADWIEVDGPAVVTGGEVDCHNDHRIAMASVILGLRARLPVSVKGTDSINTSYPEFVTTFQKLFHQDSLQKLLE